MSPAGGAQAAGDGQQCIFFITKHSAQPPNPAAAQPLHQPRGERRSFATIPCWPPLCCALALQVMRLRRLATSLLLINQTVVAPSHLGPVLAALALIHCALCRACPGQVLLA